MTLIKFNPARELFRDQFVNTQINSLFDSLFNDSLGKFERNVFFTPRVDVVESESRFEIQMALPGIKKEEIKIDIEKNVLSISGERKLESEKKEEKYHLVENFYGKFSRSFTLPENIDFENLSAELKEGILFVQIPKKEVKQNRSTVVIK
ncbi:MAG: Hsp20/alpha crystallin family protein [Bacteroidetes bacterium]|nr:Hsp20/alpha crystallin family protein [Bacteroidota bacterium]MCK6609863.1 Hsp20/alpha crystallin family protein [Bacteroidia bacterium]